MKNWQWHQASYFARNSSFERLANDARLHSGYTYSRLVKAPHQWGLPASIAIEPTTACNLGCPECPSGLKKFTRPTGNLSAKLLEQVLTELGSTLQYMTFYFQGEPFIHPGITDLIHSAASKGIYTATSTNAHFISEKMATQIVDSGLNQLLISIDGTTQEVYEQYRRRGSLEKVIEGSRNILEARKRKNSVFPLVFFQFLVVRPNQHQIAEVQALGRQIGVDDVRLKTAQVYEYKDGNPLIPTLDRYARYRQTAKGDWIIKNSLPNQCWKMWHSSVLTWDGRVVPCCFDKDASHQMGHLGQSGFKEIWFGSEYQQFRQALLRSRSEIDICKNCSEGTKVWA